MRVFILHFFLSNLSEVTLFNEDCACEWHHVAALGLVGREVWYSYFRLTQKRIIEGRFSAHDVKYHVKDRTYSLLKI